MPAAWMFSRSAAVNHVSWCVATIDAVVPVPKRDVIVRVRE